MFIILKLRLDCTRKDRCGHLSMCDHQTVDCTAVEAFLVERLLVAELRAPSLVDFKKRGIEQPQLWKCPFLF
jgi:hypothetical protein